MSAEELKEVLGYLAHPNPSVKTEACKILTQLCSNPTTFTTLASLDPVPSLLPLLSSRPPLQSASLTLLLHLSSSDPFLPLLLSHPTLSTLIELLRSSSSFPSSSSLPSSSIPPILSILTNLTRTETGAALLMQAGTPLEGLHLRRLLSLFLLPTPPTPSPYPSASSSPSPSDPYALVASLLLNISQLPSGRRFLLSASTTPPPLPSLVPYILSPNPTRQHGVLTMFRNLFLEASSHPTLLSPSLPLLPSLLLLIAGAGDVRDEERDGFFPSVLAAMQASHPRNPDPAIRRLVLECIVLAAREKAGRVYMKERRVYTVLRELHQVYEKGEEGDKELDEMLYDVVAYFILPEDDEYERERVRKVSGGKGVEERKGGGEESKEGAQPSLTAGDAGEEGRAGGEEEAADEKTAALLSELSLASKAVEGDVQQRRADREKADRGEREARAEVHRQMETLERVDASVEEGEEGEEANDDDDLPELIDDSAHIDDMD